MGGSHIMLPLHAQPHPTPPHFVQAINEALPTPPLTAGRVEDDPPDATPPFETIMFIPGVHEQGLRALPAVHLLLAAHDPPVDPFSTSTRQRWSFYIAVPGGNHVHVDPISGIAQSPTLPGGERGVVIITAALPADLHAARHISRVATHPAATVGDFVDSIFLSGRNKFDLLGGLRGRRGWVADVLGQFASDGLIADPVQAHAAKLNMRFVWHAPNQQGVMMPMMRCGYY